MFQFKQFSVDQTGCAMKINTDGVLLGAIAEAEEPKSILDIGTGTGVIALMLAQRYKDAIIDAVEIDTDAAKTAERNFKASAFADRLNVYPLGFEDYFYLFPDRKYDLIVSNPPFYIDALKSPGAKKRLAKHADIDFFDALVKTIFGHLSYRGLFWLILPIGTAEIVCEKVEEGGLFLQMILDIRSYPHSPPHRNILCYGFEQGLAEIDEKSIYKALGVYSEEYRELLKPYFMAF